MSSVRELRFLAFDLAPVLQALSLASLNTLAKPFMHHRVYMDAIIRGMNKTVPPITDAKSVARGCIVAKYYELFWYQLLSRVSLDTGLWLVRITHRTRSEALAFTVETEDKDEPNAQIMTQLFKWFANWFRPYPDNWHCWDKYGGYEADELLPVADASETFTAGTPNAAH
ncbi:MAG: hypothetical protein WA191_02265 [Telluria sp.]